MPDAVLPEWTKAYRIINSAFPPISVFEDTLDPADLEIAGLEVWWDGPRDGATLEARTAAGWRTIARPTATR